LYDLSNGEANFGSIFTSYVFAAEKVVAKMATFEIEKKTYKPYCGLREALDRQM
jgi:hypothetical protein